MKKLVKTILVIILIFFISCGKRMPKPDNLIPEDKMVEILTDLSLLNAAQSINKKLLEKKGIAAEPYIYKKYEIDSLQFAKSNEYYAHNIEIYKRIYSKLKENLNSKKVAYKKIESAEMAEKKKQDSLRREKNKKQVKKPDLSDKTPTIKNSKSPLIAKDSLP